MKREIIPHDSGASRFSPGMVSDKVFCTARSDTIRIELNSC